MDEADRLCDRIAIVDHGQLKALDSPMKLKASIPGRNVLEVSFQPAPDGLAGTPAGPARRREVTRQDAIFRIASANGPATTTALMEAARAAGVTVQSLVGPEHHARRRVRALHGPGAARRAAGARRRGTFSVHEALSACTDLGHHRTRAAAVPPQPDAHRRVADLSHRAARRAGLRVRRQRQAPAVGVVDQDHGVPAVQIRELAGASRRTRRPSTRWSTPTQGRRWPTCGTAGSTACSRSRPTSRGAARRRDAPRIALIEDNTRQLRGRRRWSAALTGLVDALQRPVGRHARIPARRRSTSSRCTRTCRTSSTCCRDRSSCRSS